MTGADRQWCTDCGKWIWPGEICPHLGFILMGGEGPSTCSVPGCEGAVLARGFCKKHYQRWKKWGDPLTTSIIRGDAAERFWSYVPQPEEGCWLWSGQQDKNGYGKMSVGGKTRRAHRFAWELANGPIPDDLYVCHTCDVPACCRPDHLWLGTNDDNMQDCKAKGRRPSGDASGPHKHIERMSRGESHGNAKLNSEAVLEIYRRFTSGEATSKDLAAEFGIGRNYVTAIGRKATWRHVF